MPHNLGYLTAQYTDHPYYKDEGKTWREGGNINQFWEYNVKDCCITWACHERILGELEKQKLDKFYFNHVQRLQPHLVKMQVGGILADTTLKDKIATELKEEPGAAFKPESAEYTQRTLMNLSAPITVITSSGNAYGVGICSSPHGRATGYAAAIEEITMTMLSFELMFMAGLRMW